MIDFQYIHPDTKKQCRVRRVAKGAKTRAEAQEAELKARKALKERKTNGNVIQKDAPFCDFAGHWLQRTRPDWKATVYRTYESILRTHWVPWFAGQTIREISIEDIVRYKQVKLKTKDKKGLSSKTINNHLAVLSSLMEAAVDWDYRPKNPVRKIKRCKIATAKNTYDYWTLEETNRFLEAVKEVRPRWLAFYTTAVRTGLRLGELAALRWSDIDIENWTIHVRRSISEGSETSPKNGESRNAYFGETTKAALIEHKLTAGKQERVFLSDEGKVLNSNRVKHSFWAGQKAANLRRIRFHDLRHSFASQLAAKRCSILELQNLMGHKRIHSTQRYAHLRPNNLRATAAQLDD